MNTTDTLVSLAQRAEKAEAALRELAAMMNSPAVLRWMSIAWAHGARLSAEEEQRRADVWAQVRAVLGGAPEPPQEEPR